MAKHKVIWVEWNGTKYAYRGGMAAVFKAAELHGVKADKDISDRPDVVIKLLHGGFAAGAAVTGAKAPSLDEVFEMMDAGLDVEAIVKAYEAGAGKKKPRIIKS